LAVDNSKFKIQNSKPDFALADDSGLEVDALDAKPGVHSARFAAFDRSADGLPANASDSENNEKLLRFLKTIPPEKRSARFHCVLAFAPVLEKKNENASPVCYADVFEAQTESFDGVCEGKIIFAPRGQNGFGYDPLFVPNGFEKTFAELGEDVKNKISHRAKALEKLKMFLTTK
ncbi:MAG: non-canonical purine NTP pyrophosphatase, partial [Limisphaerales bacterium]